MREPKSVLFALALCLGGCCQSLGMRPVTLRAQETANWCWAASTQMPIETLGEFIEQCDMANTRFGRDDCCTSGCPKNPGCNMPGWMMYSEYGYDSNSSSTPLGWQQIKQQICSAKKPLAYAYGPKSGGVGHVVVIYGFSEVAGRQDVLIRDPWAPCEGTTRAITYQEYSNSLTTDHWTTVRDIRKSP